MKLDGENIFQLEEEVPTMKLHEYLSEYKKSKDIEYFRWFLHSFEEKLNAIIKKYVYRYSAMNSFFDLKSIYVTTLFYALGDWEKEDTSDFLFANKFVLRDALLKHISRAGGAFAIHSESHFKALRKVSYLYSNTVDLHGYSNTVDLHGKELLECISKATKLPLATVTKLLVESNLFAYYDDIDPRNDDGISMSIITNINDNVDFIAERSMLLDTLAEEIDKLPFREQEIFLQSIGISCHWCLRTCRRQTYMELANRFQLSGESAAEKLNKKARLALLANLAENNVLDFVWATRKSENEKTITYTYFPKADKSAEHGVITINKADFSYKVEVIAELDTMLSTKYAKRVIWHLKEHSEFTKSFIYVWRL